MTEPFHKTGKTHTISNWKDEDKDLVAGFTNREGGYSPLPFKSLNMGFHVQDDPLLVQQNRSEIAKEIQFKLKNWIGSKQIHDTNILKVSKQDTGKGAIDFESALPDTDGLYTDEAGILLTSLYADCVPLYFYSKKNNLIGLAHAGWKGTVGKIGPKMIDLWTQQENADVTEIKVAIGPSIGICCYEVDEYVMSKVRPLIDKDSEKVVFSEKENGKFQLNLQKLNEILLLQAGLLQKNIVISNYCTCCNNSLFFSYRKENGKTGRMMSYIGRKGV